MEEHEFKRVLNLFPVVRSRDFVIDEDSSRRSTSGSSQNQAREWQDAWDEGEIKGSGSEGSYQPGNAAFWEKLKLAAQEKVTQLLLLLSGGEIGSGSILAFRQLHQKLVFEELDLHAAQNFVKSRNSRQ